MLKLNLEPQIKNFIFIISYFLGIILILFMGEYYFEYLLGYGITFISYSYFVYYLSKNDLKNEHFKNFIFISLLFLWLRFPFVLKTNMHTLDFNIYYSYALNFLRESFPLFYYKGYGPVFYLFLWLPTLLSNGDYFAIKFFFSFLDYFNLILLYFITKELKIKSNYKILLLYTLMPILIFEFAWHGHNDTGVVFLTLLSIYFILKDRYIFSSSCLFMAIAYKYYAIFLIPLYLIYIYKKHRSPKIFLFKLFSFFSPFLMIVSFFLVINPQLLFRASYFLLNFSIGYNIVEPSNGFIVSIKHFVYSSNLYIVSGHMLQKINIDIFIMYIPLALCIFYILTFKNTNKKISPNIKFLFLFSIILIFMLHLILPSISEDIWFYIMNISINIVFAYLLLKDFEHDYKTKFYILISFSSFIFILAKLLTLDSSFYMSFKIYLISLMALYLFTNYFYFNKLKELNNYDFLFSIFYSLMIFLSFFSLTYSWYFLWVIPIILIFYNRNTQFNFLIIFVPLYLGLISAAPFYNFKDLSVLSIDLFSNLPFKIFLLSILMLINVIITIKIVKQEKFHKNFLRMKIFLIFLIWILIIAEFFNVLFSDIIFQYISKIQYCFYFTKYPDYYNFFQYSYLYYYYSISYIYYQTLNIYLIEVIFSILPIYYIVDKYLITFLKPNPLTNDENYTQYYNPSIITIYFIFLINSIPLTITNIFQIPFNLLALFLLIHFIFKGTSEGKYSIEDFKSN